MDRIVALLRNSWRQLTSMRTALVLLFLLALAAIPGSLLPQRNVNIENVQRWFADNPRLAPVLDRLGGFDVYSSPWFSAIYLLLFISLLGCLVPRLRDHLRSLRNPPVDAPRRMVRLPQHAAGRRLAGEPAAAAAAVRDGLRKRRWRSAIREHPDGSVTVSAEKGYLKESGNLLMHFAMVAILVGVGLGTAYGWHGNRPVVVGPETGFCSSLQQYSEFGLGTRVGTDHSFGAFCLEMTGFEADYTDAGVPTRFLAHAEVRERGEAPRPVEFTVNAPLRLERANIYLFGHSYAPVLRYTDRFGRTQTDTVMFFPGDPNGTAEGVAMFPDANVDPDGERDPSLQVAFQGMYLPTAPADLDTLNQLLAMDIAPTSVHSQERAPALALQAYRGDLGLDRGIPQSVFEINQEQVADGVLEPVGEPRFIRIGETMTLDDGTTLEFLRTEPSVLVSVRYDPGEPVVLIGAVLLMAGLVASLTGRRRRVWFRLTPDQGRSLVEAGGLPRSDHPGFSGEFERLVDDLVPECEAAPELATRSM
jgi:cytochrome c biogenesis protein